MDQSLAEFIERGFESLRSRGLSEQDAADVAVEATLRAADKVAPAVAKTLMGKATRRVRRERRRERQIERRVHRQWGRALNRYYIAVMCLRQMGIELHEREQTRAEQEDDKVFEVLSGLHARACRIALEVLALLRCGFERGAMARGRTLHELAVLSIVIGEHGRREEHADLAEKFLMHWQIAACKEAEFYQKQCEVLGYEPLERSELEEIRNRRDELIARFGEAYSKKADYGWADGLVKPLRFDQLEILAGYSHLRLNYKMASHEVHADSLGLVGNQAIESGRNYMEVGPSMMTSAEPAYHALVAACQTGTSMLLAGPVESTPSDILGAKALAVLVETCGDELAAAQRAQGD
jgi:hypothetical protein